MIECTVPETTDFELRRQQNITRNENFLKSLGLDIFKSSIKEDKILEAQDSIKNQCTRSKKRRKTAGLPNDVVVRRSLRRGATAGANSNIIENNRSDKPVSNQRDLWHQCADENDFRKKKITALALMEYIKMENFSHSEMVSGQAISHCVMRVNSMSVTALVARLRKLQNQEKLIVFYYALKFAGLEDLAALSKSIAKELNILL